MWLQESRDSFSKIKPRPIILTLLQNQRPCIKHGENTHISNFLHNCSRCRQWYRLCSYNKLLHHSQPTNIMEAVDITEDRNNLEAREDVVLKVEEIGEVAMVDGVTVIWHITVGLMECVPTQELTSETCHKATIITHFGATRCQGANTTVPYRSGW